MTAVVSLWKRTGLSGQDPAPGEIEAAKTRSLIIATNSLLTDFDSLIRLKKFPASAGARTACLNPNHHNWRHLPAISPAYKAKNC
jgi:hypothetical protein